MSSKIPDFITWDYIERAKSAGFVIIDLTVFGSKMGKLMLCAGENHKAVHDGTTFKKYQLDEYEILVPHWIGRYV